MRIITTLLAAAVCVAAFGQSTVGYGTVTGPLQSAHISLGGGQGLSYGPVVAYDNTVNPLGYYFPTTTMYAADDLHMTGAGLVNGFTFIYYDPAGGTALTTVPVEFWGNDPFDGSIVGPIASFTIGGLPGDGAWIITVDLTGGFEFNAPADVWMGVHTMASDSPESGWMLYDPPIVGSSHDLFLNIHDLGLYWFGGAPVANFGAAVYMTPEPGAIAAVGVGLIGLLGLRRRK